jgi:hypothetical protein
LWLANVYAYLYQPPLSETARGKPYLEVLNTALLEHNLLIQYVNEQIPVSRANTAIAARETAVGIVERGGGYSVCESAAVAGCLVLLFRS